MLFEEVLRTVALVSRGVMVMVQQSLFLSALSGMRSLFVPGGVYHACSHSFIRPSNRSTQTILPSLPPPPTSLNGQVKELPRMPSYFLQGKALLQISLGGSRTLRRLRIENEEGFGKRRGEWIRKFE